MDLFSLTHEELTGHMGSTYGKGRFFADVLTREVFKRGNIDFHLCPEFSKSGKFAARFKNDLVIPVPFVNRVVTEGKTIKFLLRFHDGLESESVIIPMQNHSTLCVSSQIGCKMGCRFCETGHMGFMRDLTVSEIISQVYAARFVLNKSIKNIVFMGMGEPFDNFSNVRKAILILNDQRGFDFAHRHITVSTAGLIPGIEELSRLSWSGIHLAVSLNAPNDSIRSRLMPINNRYTMNELRRTLLNYPLKPRGVILIEYVLIKGINDSKEHADELADYLSPVKHIRLNLIPLNKTSRFPNESTTDNDINRFASYFENKKIFVIKRWSKGATFGAGCGQLGNAGRSASSAE